MRVLTFYQKLVLRLLVAILNRLVHRTYLSEEELSLNSQRNEQDEGLINATMKAIKKG